MSNTNIEDVMVQLTETRNELSEEDLRLWDGLENERVSRIAGDDANKSLTLQVQDSVSGTERRLSTEVIHREQGDLDKLGLLNQLSQSMSAYRIKTDKEIEAERFARDILGINLDARITTAEASFNHKELKLYQDIQEVFTDLDGKYTSMDARIKKYEEMLQDITMDSIKITMDNGEINMGAWTILSQAREWDLEILAKMRGFQEKTNEDVNQALEELQNQLPITENIINEIMENLSESPLIAELRDALNESIDTSESLELRLAREEAARAQAMIDLAYANAQALAAEKAALTESLAAEAQARADEVQEEADRRIESIRQIRADLAQDVGELNDQVDSIRDGAIADKAGILETVNNYKTELKSDIATVNTELLGALDGVNTLVTEVRDDNGVTLNELTTYKASNDVAVAGLLSKVTTNISDTAANASKITGLTTGLATTNTELGKVRNTSASALSKADTAVTANSALSTRVDALAAAITDLGEGAETTVDVYAFNALKAEVVTNSSGITSLVEQVDALGTSYTNLTDGVQANTDAVSTLTVKQSEMNGDISQLASDVTFLTSELGVIDTALNTKASNQALSNLSTKLTTTDGKVAANTQQLTQLNTDFATVRDGLETKASTEALNNLATEVTELEDGLAVNASAITSLKSEIDTELDKKATVTAVNGLTTKVEEVEGKTTTNANNLLALNTDVANVVSGLANKLDASAISDYYTKSQTDDKAAEVAAGKVEEFSANLVIGGTNLLKNSHFEQSNTNGWSNAYGVHKVEDSLYIKTITRVNSAARIDKQFGGGSLELGETYTLSILVQSDVNLLWGGFSNATFVKSKDAVAGEEFKVTYVTFIPTAFPVYIRAYCSNAPIGSVIRIDWEKLEKGNVATDWSESPEETKDSIDANSTAIQTTNAEVSRVDDLVIATNSAQTLLEGRVETVEGGIAKKADASALSSLDTRVGTVEGQYTTQASDITKLSNSLDTTIVDVGTAQAAAQNAMNAAGAKGKVIFGNSAPAVVDRLVQNLWIDTTSNANTPKRWNGSAWVVVTDKVATDAAKAVSDLDTVVKTKADVTALNSLTTKVTDDAKKTTANTNSITELNSDIVKINNDLATKANASALSDMYTKSEVDDKAAEIAAGEVSKFGASLVIGGTNLQKNSHFAQNNANGWSSIYGTHTVQDSLYVKTFTVVTGAARIEKYIGAGKLEIGETYTLSILVKSDVDIFWRNSENATQVKSKSVVAGDTFNVAYVTFIPTAFPVTLRAYCDNAPIGSVVQFEWEKLEKGNVVTDWSESPEDTQEALEANATAIQATNAEVIKVDDKTVSNANSIITLNSDVTEVKNGLTTKANTSALQDYYTKTETDGVATTAAAGEISKYDANLVIGGSNLVDHNEDAWIQGSIAEGKAVGSSYASLVLNSSTRVRLKELIAVREEDFVVSVKNSNYDCCIALFDANRGYLGQSKGFIGFKGTHNIKALVGGGFVVVIIRKVNNTSLVPSSVAEALVQLEYGTKATDWSPSSNVILGAIDANATAIENTNAEVKKVDGRVTTESNRITALTGRVDTAEKGLALKADTTALNDIYTKTESDAKATSLAAGEISKYDASLVIGGSNLQDNADFKTNSTNRWSAKYGNVTSIEGGIQYKGTSVSGAARIEKTLTGLEVGQTYTLSVWAKSPVPLEFRGLVDATAIKNIMPESHDPSVFQRYTCTFIPRVVTGAIIRAYVPNLALPDLVILNKEKLEVGSKGTDWSPSSSDIQSSLDVNANAISTTNAEVFRIDGVVKGHVTDIRNLTTSIAGKADSSALSALTVRVTDEEKKSSTQASDITSLTSKADDLLDVVTIKDTRSTNQLPSWYLANYARRSVNEFKSQSAIGVSGFFGGTYCNLETKVYYTDLSGGQLIQTATSSVDPSSYVQRVSTSASVWGAWKQPIKDLRDTLGTKASASAVQTLTTEVERVDGVAKSAAASTVTLTSRMDNAENALQVQAKVVDGVKASYMVKMETNGVIGGFGLMQSTGVLGQVVTSFGVNANSFFIGAPASKKQPFIVTTTNQVVNGVAYPAGTYIDVALIANATIGTAKIADLAVTGAKIANATIDNAKIANLDAAKINTGTLNAARIGVGSISADKINASVFKSVGADGSSSTISGGTIRAYYPNGKIAFHIGVS